MGWFNRRDKIIGDTGGTFSLSSREPVRTPSKEGQLTEYRELVFSCVALRAQEAATYNPRFGKYNSNNEFIEDPRHILKTLISNPNDYQTDYELWEATQTYIDLQGEMFWYLEVTQNSRIPVRIHMVKPSAVEVVVQDRPDESGRIKMGDVAGYVVSTSNQQVPLERDEVIHFKTFNPSNPYRGLSLIEAGFQSISIDRMTGEFQQSFMANNATPSSIISVKGNISRDAFDKVKRLFADRYAGSGNAGKSMFIKEADIDIKQLGLSLADLDFTELKQGTAERIRGIFGVPKCLLGSNDGAGLSRANIEAEEYIFQKYQIENIKSRFDAQLELFARRFDPDIVVIHDANIIQDRQMELQEDQALIGNLYTKNEARQRRGLEPVEGGDTLYVPFNLMAIDDPKEQSTKTFKAIKKTRQIKIAKSLHDKLGEVEDKLAPKIETLLVRQLNEQLKSVLNLVDRKAGRKSIQISQYELDGMINTESILEALVRYLVQALQAGGDLASLVTGNPDVTFIVEQAKRDAVFQSTERLLKSFDEDTVIALQQQIGNAAENRLTVDELKRNIEKVYKDAKGYRAERIARTELYRVTNEGLAEGYKQQGYTHTVWKINPGACEYCRSLQDKVAGIGSAFVNMNETLEGVEGGSFTNTYQDVQTPPVHPNCRCALEPVTEANLKQYETLNDDSYAVALEIENDRLAKALEEQTSYSGELENLLGVDDGEK